ncbi:MAG TPA: metallophosphoesterase [Alphaproteobacteria bacterium]|nr:metallophosphoesterase [Alphaproteobacteria bacterium]
MRSIGDLVRGRAGLRVIGDVQGYADLFGDLVNEARRLGLAVLQLGDIIDRGPDSPGAMALMLDLAARGDGMQIAGNHCDKFYRLRQGRRVEIAKSGLAMTLQQLDRRPDGEKLARRYADYVARLPLWLGAGAFFFVHGAFHPEMRGRRSPTVADRHREKRLASLALFGETSGETMADGKPVRTYRWLDQVPSGLTVCIGHDVVSTSEIIVRESAAGGRVVHLDLGPDRGGRIGHLDIERERLLGTAQSRSAVPVS